MLFKEFSATKKRLFRVMDDQGRIIAPAQMPDIGNELLVKSFKDMLFARTADQMIVSYQRQGRIYTYPPNLGQEAIHAAVARVMRPDDWLVPAFREMGVWLAKGVTLKDIFLYFMGNEEGGSFSSAPNMLPVSVPIASQLPHAAGIGYAVKLKKLDQVVYAFTGDGGTSEGDFHEALNFAAVWQAPVIFIIQNNQFAISVPLRMQTASESLAIKAQAYGMPGLQVDGNDFFAMLGAVREAESHTREGRGPVLIEAVTYRQGAHTTSDDPTKYRTREEEEAWQKKDPVNRLRGYLTSQKLWNPEEEEQLIAQYRKEIDRIFIEAENHPPYPLEDVFQYHYAEMPDELKRQKIEHERFLEWSRTRMKKEVAR